mmetsp:Transcript_19659/g.42726  ORF Transcript_19659/g.42726 Transcript_19659/m.42726 type:complete len:1045 (-) Transcript_19659:2973-6107(-)|eukprot:CAMPEP_0172309436 /NCGR_PEP_ID=MMETSP1058-20130122/9726_1 /TAXON_ID=83371 /ORGANISM="Detonula confervacea, Strain CCMP 353" /LENGTH=1044 /DNA_ID=CAMNT_0013022063 /DNA_START=195 /DNA_END=3329 /DNA_ORIENTATION=-
MITDLNKINEVDDASLSSEDSQEPYYQIGTGKIFPAREAWVVLAAEGHARFQAKLNGRLQTSANGSIFRSPTESMEDNAPPFLPETPNDEDSETDIEQVVSFSGPTQSSIDRALHPESPNYISPNKDLKQVYEKSLSYEGTMEMDGHNAEHDDGETDPIILRAKAMALAAQNGQKLTPEQMQLIAQPDVQQQKLIEEAKRAQKAKELQHSQQQSVKLQQIGADFKKFIKTEKEKPPLQWGADLGKFIENQKANLSTPGAENFGVDGSEGRGDNNEDGSNATVLNPGPSPPAASQKRKMEGFGSDPSPLTEGATVQTPSSIKSMWPSMNIPTLPLLNESITNVFPGAGGNKGVRSTNTIDSEEAVRISGILWKRRSGFGKHSTIKAWEKRRVELRGSKLIYYRTEDEEDEEDQAAPDSSPDAAAAAGGNTDNAIGLTTPRDPPSEVDGEPNQEEQSEAPSNIDPASLSSSKRSLSIFGQAAQAAEQRIQTAREELTRFASVTGLESLKPVSADTPRGVLDLLKEKASVSASMGHSGAPTPFCLSIKVKSETKWKLCTDSHGMLMEWLSAVTDVIVEASVDGASTKSEGSSSWEIENYCLQSRGGMEEKHRERDIGGNGNPALSTVEMISAPGTQRSAVGAAVSAVEETGWMILGNNLYIAWALVNVALILARSSSISIDQYWKLMVFTNFGIWQLCTRSKVSSLLRSIEIGAMGGVKPNSLSAPGSTTISARKGLHKPIAGITTVQVTNEGDPNINKNGHQLPSWVPISSRVFDVRSHGYLATKKKIPSPGELYECVAVDCFVSNTRFPEIAPRVKFDRKFDIDSTGKTWKCPDIFIVSIAIPMEAPRFGQSTDDGRGLTYVGYFKMKDETRKILRRITAAEYDPSTDTSESEIDIQKRVVNGVRLWERYCQEAPNDPAFQARFKLIPSGNLAELGCPSYIAKYNGKPVLIKRNQVTGFFTDYPSLNVMEFDISLHPFPYLFKQATAYLKDYLDKFVGTYGFVIEGRNDEELPEVVIGAMKVCYPSPKFIVSGEDFFAGTCPKVS